MRETGQRVAVRVLRASDDLALPLEIEVVSRFRHTAMAMDRRGDPVTLLGPGKLAGPRSAVVETLPESMGGALLTVLRSTDGEGSQGDETLHCRRQGSEVLHCRRQGSEVLHCDLESGQTAFDDEMLCAMGQFLRTFAPAHSLWRMAVADSDVRRRLKWHRCALEDSRLEVPDISGLGAGLTPGSDDYLLGMLAVGHAMGCAWHGALARSVRAALPSCAPVSRLMLVQALEGRFPEVVLNFFRDRTKGALIDFVRHGSSSGFDTVFGMLATTGEAQGFLPC